MRLLDLFCGGGGAAEGYARAGFTVTGVDIDPQPNYPYEFIRADALEVLEDHEFLAGFDAIHASPPCQSYSTGVSSASSPYVQTKGKDEPALIDPVHDLLEASGIPWIMENVMGARLHMPFGSFVLCGSMFGRPIPRHRVFATNCEPMWSPWHPDCSGLALRSSLQLGWEYRDMSVTGKGRRAGTRDRWAQLIGVDHHMSQHDLAESIPPAYTDYLGRQLARNIAESVGATS